MSAVCLSTSSGNYISSN